MAFVDVVLSWSRDSEGRTAVLRRQSEDGGWSELGRVAGTEFVAEGVDPARAHTFAAAAVLEDGDLAPDDTWEILRVAPVADETTPERPGTPAGFAVVQDGAMLTARWDAATDGLVASYELRVGDAWEDAQLIAEDLVAGPYTWTWSTSGDQVVHLKAIDKLGRASLIAAEVTVSVAALETYVTDGTSDLDGGGFAGTKTNVEVDTGVLRLTRLDPFGNETDPFGSYDGVPCFARYWHTGVYEPAVVNVGALEAHRLELELAAEQPTDANVPFGAYRVSALGRQQSRDGTWVALGTPGVAARSSWRHTALRPVDLTVEIDTSDSAAGAWDGWRVYVPGTYTFWRVRLRVTLRGDGFRFTRVPTLKLRRRLLNLKDEGSVAIGGGAAVTVTYTTNFVNIPKVTASLIGPNAVLGPKILITNQTRTTFDIEVFNNAGASVAADLDWHALGP